MKKDVFITGLASFFPNSPVSNDEIEEVLGHISGKHSKVQRIVLKQNGIKRRYYALNKNQEITHTNAEMAMLAIRKLLALTNKSQKDIDLLARLTVFPSDSFAVNKKLMVGNILPLIVSELEVQDIDNLTDWKIAEMKYRLMTEEK